MVSFRSVATRLGTVAAAVLLVGGVASCAVPADSPIASPLPGCVAYDALTEKIIGTAANELGGPYPSVGDSSSYLGYLYDSGGTRQVGTVYGKAEVPYRQADGDLMARTQQTVQLAGGTVKVEGIYDLTAANTGAWQRLAAIGIGGGYQDKLGWQSFQTTSSAPIAMRLDLCAAGLLRSAR